MARALLVTIALALSFVLALGSSTALAQGDGRTSGNGGLSYIKASTCCPGCRYPGSCCCAPRDKLPATSVKTKYLKTRTITKKGVLTVTRTIFKTATKRLTRRDGRESWFQIDVDTALAKRSVEPAIDAQPVAESGILEARAPRNLCPVCPKGVQVQGKTGAGAKYCCPARKTVFRTVKRTSTKTVATSTKVIKKTATKTITLRSFGVQIYQDKDRNKKFNSPPDVAYPKGAKMALINLGPGGKRRLATRQEGKCKGLTMAYAAITTGGRAKFDYEPKNVKAQDVIAVAKAEACNEPLVEIVVPETGELPVVNTEPILVEYLTTTTPGPTTTEQEVIPTEAIPTEVIPTPAATTGTGSQETPAPGAATTTTPGPMSTTFGPLATFVFDTRKGMNLTSPVDCVKRNVMDVNSTNEQVQVRIEIWGGDAKDNLTGGQTAMFCDVEGIPVGIRTHGFDQYRNPVVAPLSLYMHFGAAFQDYVPGVEPAFPSWNGFNVVGFKISKMNTSLLTNKQLSAIIEVKEFMTENYFTLQNATFSTIGSYNFSSPQATTKYVDYKQDLHFYNPCKEASAPGTYATCEEVSGYVVHLSEIVVQPWFYMEPPPPM